MQIVSTDRMVAGLAVAGGAFVGNSFIKPMLGNLVADAKLKAAATILVGSAAAGYFSGPARMLGYGVAAVGFLDLLASFGVTA